MAALARLGRVVALVGDADDLVAEAEREEQLGRVRHEGDDPHVGREDMSEWREEDGELVRDFEFTNFAAAMAFVNRVAEAAEEANHHPDILVHGWNKVRLTLSTHSEGTITDNDHALAAHDRRARLSRRATLRGVDCR